MTRVQASWRELNELASRLLALIPAARPLDWQTTLAAQWREEFMQRTLVPFARTDSIELGDLLCVDDQKRELRRNTERFLKGYPANNALLWGARGTGKSSLIHALLNRYAGEGLRLVEVDKRHLVHLPSIAERLADEAYRFVLFCDDLSFEADDASYKVLKSALEGSVFKASGNVLIYATSNRRHLLPERMQDNLDASYVDGELHQGEAIEEKVSLSDRFGLWLSFYPFKQNDYLSVAEHWVRRLADGTPVDAQWNDDARQHALRWALARGVRNGRTAQHFARHWVGERLLERDEAGG